MKLVRCHPVVVTVSFALLVVIAFWLSIGTLLGVIAVGWTGRRVSSAPALRRARRPR